MFLACRGHDCLGHRVLFTCALILASYFISSAANSIRILRDEKSLLLPILPKAITIGLYILASPIKSVDRVPKYFMQRSTGQFIDFHSVSPKCQILTRHTSNSTVLTSVLHIMRKGLIN